MIKKIIVSIIFVCSLAALHPVTIYPDRSHRYVERSETLQDEWRIYGNCIIEGVGNNIVLTQKNENNIHIHKGTLTLKNMTLSDMVIYCHQAGKVLYDKVILNNSITIQLNK